MKKEFIIVLLVGVLMSCKKNNNSTPTPTTPQTPPANTPNYAIGRIPLIGWGLDTFVCFDSLGNKIDSFTSYTGTGGQSMINHRGAVYVLWMDSTLATYDTGANLGILAPIGIGATIYDTTSMGNMFFTYYTYPLTKTDYATGKQYKRAREIWFTDLLLNSTALSGAWFGREYK